MVARTGHVTSAISAIRTARSWDTYYKAIQTGKWSWTALVRQWLRLLLSLFPAGCIEFVLDDFITCRSSRKAPAVGRHHDHCKRPNRPTFLLGQLRVSLAVICRHRTRAAALPLLYRLMPVSGNTNKLRAAKTLVRVLLKWLPRGFPVILLMDAWYMKGPLLLPLTERGVTIIGQVRKDTMLYLDPLPRKPGTRGRQPKFGQRITRESITALCPLRNRNVRAYGKMRLFQLREITAKARFLKGRPVKVVWCRFMNDLQRWSEWRLILSTDPAMSGAEIVERYARRWLTEPMFNEVKHHFGLQNAWQQTRRALARWTALLSLAYGLPRLLALRFGPEAGYALFPIPWRRGRPVTAGWMAEAVGNRFRNVAVRDLWDPKSGNFRPDWARRPPDFHRAA
jgi:hypothetical protein